MHQQDEAESGRGQDAPDSEQGEVQAREAAVEQGREVAAQGREVAAQGREAAAPGGEAAVQGREAAAQGREAAAAQARDQSRVGALRAAVLAFARARLAPLSPEDAAAITALGDEHQLRELVDTLTEAATVSDARAVLDAAIAGAGR